MKISGITRFLPLATSLSLLVSFAAGTNTGMGGQTPMQSRRATPRDADGASRGIMLGDSIKLGDGSLCCVSANADAASMLVNNGDKSF